MNYAMDKQEFEQSQIKYQQQIDLNSEMKYKEQRGWGIVKVIQDLKKMAPLCKYPYRGHKQGCSFCNKKRYYYDVIDKNQNVWALYFSMNLHPLWSKLRKKWPHWTEGQVQNNRYWSATKRKLLRELEIEFLKEHPGPWCRALNRAPGHITYTFGIWYNPTMEQIGINLRWPPEPHPITVQFLGRPKPGVDLSWAPFILSEETINNPRKKPYKKPTQIKQITTQEHADFVDMATSLKLGDFE